ncbi:MAG: heme-binding protein [Acidimicrobiia bacterium]
MSGVTLAEATAVVAAAQARAVEIGRTVCIAVFDSGGHLVAFARMDGSPTLSVEIAQAKASGTALSGFDGNLLLKLYDSVPAKFAALGQLSGRPIFPGPGSLPLHRDGVVVGAIGVSGSPTADDDHLCAEAGVAAFPG